MSKSLKLKIGIVGLGMVGEPIKRWFEEQRGYKRGRDLFCYDTDSKKGYSDDINKADIIFVSVPTPPNPNGSCNISIVENTVNNLKDGKIVVIKSTVTPGTVEKLQKRHPKKLFLFNPEFLTETQAWLDFLKPDRQIIGFTKKSISDAKEILLLLPSAPFVRPGQLDYSTKKQVNATEAEIAKYGANVFGYLKVIYGNILADVAYALSNEFKNEKIDSGVDYENIKEIISADGRIGPAWLDVNHGNYCGAGGYCFPKDMAAFIGFVGHLIKNLEMTGKKSKSKTDNGLIDSLKNGKRVLESVHGYNKGLLKWQNLTIDEMSKHDKEIVGQKRKVIRV